MRDGARGVRHTSTAGKLQIRFVGGTVAVVVLAHVEHGKLTRGVCAEAGELLRGEQRFRRALEGL